jgi:hypothetical protein
MREFCNAVLGQGQGPEVPALRPQPIFKPATEAGRAEHNIFSYQEFPFPAGS